jgi:hypothetical protein
MEPFVNIIVYSLIGVAAIVFGIQQRLQNKS